MQKKVLLAMPQLSVTPKMVQMVNEDKGEKKIERYWYSSHRNTYWLYKRYTFFRAVEKEGILKVALFKRGDIAAGQTEPMYEIYIDRANEQYLTYSPTKEKWYTARFENLDTERERGENTVSKTYSVGNAKEIVNRYFGKENHEIEELIRTWQYETAQDRLQKKYRRETNRIDEVMNCVPEIPGNFDKWAVDKGFWNEKHLFYDRAERKAYCTACDKEMTIDKKVSFKHGYPGKCPNCHRPVTYRAWNKQKTVRPEVHLGLFQKLTDGTGYVLRKFRAASKRTRENGWDKRNPGCWEEIRITFDNNFNRIEFYEWGLYRPYGVERWTTGINHGSWYYNYIEDVRIYPGNLNQTLKGSSLQYIPLKQLMEKYPGKAVEFSEILAKLKNTPQYEYLIKYGLYKFVFSALTKPRYSGYVFNKAEKRLWRFLGITQEQLEYAAKHNSSYEFIKTCQRATLHKVNLTPNQAEYMTKYNVNDTLLSKMGYTTPHKILRYIDEVLDQKNNNTAAGDYSDYLRDCERLNLPMDETILFPQNFRRAEQLCIEAVREIDEAKSKEFSEIQEKAFKKSQEEKKKLYAFEDNNFILILPTTKKEFTEEGREMHNCVGSYYDDVKEGKTTVLFLRRKEEPEKCFCTVEVKGTELIQCRSKYNREAPQEAMNFMDKFIGELTRRLSSKKYIKNHEKAVRELLNQLRSA